LLLLLLLLLSRITSTNAVLSSKIKFTLTVNYCVYAMPNSRFHFAISAGSCVHKRHFVISATHES